ncbi:di-heme-cytochrome C peroxidase [Sphingopyxis sp. PET50]|uniref:di-heme-cytochrome C peroxidase n=1 Tax=Sphingopyxis sp. PET50 TaxID=2976533 RepID=UPI0021AF588E|nr:di-heme-cytochrome C peroxidase [Sphingopyxis sp. PET50]
MTDILPATGRRGAALLATAMGATLLLGACMTKGDKGPLTQGWTRAEQLAWYHGDQGSRLIPHAWLMALEEKGSQAKFFTFDRMAALGYLPPDADDSDGLKYGLPIGFALNTRGDDGLIRSRLRWKSGQGAKEPWVGMNCAACHTNEIRHGDAVVRVEGGPGMTDFQTFIEELDLAAEATLADPAKFDRFAAAVLGAGAARDKDLLRGALKNFVAWEAQVKALNDPPDRPTSRYGHGRLDAVGHILNKVALINQAQDPFTGAADAPVSYPFLWNIAQHDKVQWNGFAPNRKFKLPSGDIVDVGGLGRNTGEVIGVFGDVNISTPYPGLDGYASSVNVTNLDAMEVQVAKLLPPAWPGSFPKPDAALAERGRILFAEECVSCHAILAPDDLDTDIKAVLTPIWAGPRPVGTDPWMACNTMTIRNRTGNLKDVPEGYFGSGPKYGAVGSSRQMLVTSVAGSLSGKKLELAEVFAKAGLGLPRRIDFSLVAPGSETAQKTAAQRLAICMAEMNDPLLVYKARPLNGIWATAPYLHNGSVRSLYELLLPPAQRAASFTVGSKQFDPVKVGFVDATGSASFRFSTTDTQGRPIPGNSNMRP